MPVCGVNCPGQCVVLGKGSDSVQGLRGCTGCFAAGGTSSAGGPLGSAVPHCAAGVRESTGRCGMWWFADQSYLQSCSMYKILMVC
jgi:hypothetical protein